MNYKETKTKGDVTIISNELGLTTIKCFDSEGLEQITLDSQQVEDLKSLLLNY